MPERSPTPSEKDKMNNKLDGIRRLVATTEFEINKGRTDPKSVRRTPNSFLHRIGPLPVETKPQELVNEVWDFAREALEVQSDHVLPHSPQHGESLTAKYSYNGNPYHRDRIPSSFETKAEEWLAEYALSHMEAWRELRRKVGYKDPEANK